MSTRFSNKKSLLPSLGVSLLCVLVIASALLALAHSSKPIVAHATTSSFSFTYTGDYDHTAQTTANLQYIAGSGVNFHLALGDFNYDKTSTADAWGTYAKSLLPANFPFEIVAGAHDSSQMSTYETDLPDQIGNISATCSACAYGQQYYFDYPVAAPLARIIMVSPNQTIPGYTYNYNVGGADYNWVSNAIDAAHAANIPWVFVGMHEYCFVIGTAACGNQQLLDLLLRKHVDLIMQAQKHDYQASKQLALNDTTCQTLNAASYNPSCVVDSTTNMSKGAGSVILVTGTGGASQLAIDTSDPKISYFRNYMGANLNETWGVSQFTVTPTQLIEQFVGTSEGTFTDGFTITDGSATPIPTPSLPPSPTASPSPTPSPTITGTPTPLQPGPVNKLWYFAEGRVGAGFNEWLSLDNPTANACQVNITYLYTPDRGSAQTKTVPVSVPANQRVTEYVDGDLGTSTNGFGVTDSAIVTVDTTTTPNCTGIVAERPMYFNALGTKSGSDVLGVSKLGTTFYIADVAVNGQAGGGSYSSFLPILNPPNSSGPASVTATYYANGMQVGQQTATVAIGTRGTIFPNNATPALPTHVSVVVTSSVPVDVERPTYFSNINGGNAGTVSGGADVIGVQTLSSDWLFAEGYTGGQFQEYFAIANLDASANATAVVTIKLEFQGGGTSSFTINVPSLSETIWNVNTAAPNTTVSAEITSTGAKIVAEREMFFRYNHQANGRSLQVAGGTDALGQVGPATSSLYSFAEGYVNTGYDEWLTLQNPTASAETIWVTLYNALGHTYTFSLNVAAQSRATQDIAGIVLHSLYQNGDGYKGLEVSMTVQTTSVSGGPFVAERPMYWNASGTQGGTDIIGYTGD